ncbi:MAG: hypothetical protein IPK81_09945 [Rhodospirillales bacterium]|nr:MAG: hypothetical protein IPK81_09945 [Rhodospirillales bacterium]
MSDSRKIALLSGVAALALAVAPVSFVATDLGFGGGAAFAQSGGGHSGAGQGGAGGSGKGGSTKGTGQGGPSADSDAKGPKFKGGETRPEPGSRGGKPVWAQEGIPEIELGRLNVARAPAHVLEKAFYEALANFDPTKSAALYSMSAAEFAAYLRANYATVVRVDSPLENLGLLKDILADGQTQLPGVTPRSKIDLAAIFLGSASDKTIPITTDTVRAMITILGMPALSDAEISALAAGAEAVRQAILAGHG